MRKQFKKIMSVVLSAAMVLSLGTSTNLRTVSADDETTTGTETTEEGFTAMIGFQTNDWDCRDAIGSKEQKAGPAYLEWLAETDETFDLEAYKANNNPNGYNIYLNGAVAQTKSSGELKAAEDTQFNRDAVIQDAQITEDGDYTVRIENLDLTERNPDVLEANPVECFNMLYIAADIPPSKDIKITASSVKIDDEEVAKDVELPQKGDTTKFLQAMVANIHVETDGTEGNVAFANGADGYPDKLTKIPSKSIEISFNITGVDWDAVNGPQPTDEATEAPTETPDATVGPIDVHEISQPFDIGILVNVNPALTEKVGTIEASAFGTEDFWTKFKAAETSFSEDNTTFYNDAANEAQVGSLHIEKTGEYELKVKSLVSSEDLEKAKSEYLNLVEDGAIWLPLIPNQMPEDYNLIGETITVGDKEYAWNAKLSADSSGSVRLPVCNQWASDDVDSAEYKVANPITEEIPVREGDLITFKFAVTGDAPAKPSPTPVPTEAPPAKSYNAYLGFQTDNYIFRDEWQNKKTGMNPTDKDLLAAKYDYKKHVAFNWDKKYTVYDATIKDSEIVKNDAQYDLSISGPNIKTIKGTGADAVTAKQFNMIFISTDIPLTMKGVKCTKATLKLDGKVIKEYATVPNKHDASGYYMFMLANAYASEADVKAGICERYEYMKENTLKVIPEKSIEVSFTISGVNFDKTTVGPAKGKTFTKGAFKYKVTKESQVSASTKKTSTGNVTLVGLSKAGKKAKKLTIPATLTQKKGKFKVTKMKAGALKGAKAKAVTVGKNIKALPANAFKDCKKLNKLTLKAKLSSVNKSAFKGCSKAIKIAGTGKKQNLKKIKKAYKKAK